MLLTVGLLLHVTLVSVHSISLAGSKDKVGSLVWSAEGNKINSPFKVFAPKLPGPEWKILGHRCQKNYNEETDVPIRRYREEKEGHNFMRKPDGFQFIWDTRRSIIWMDGSVWRVNCPIGFVSLGDVFYNADEINDPTALFQTVACVHADLVVDCEFGDQVWNDLGGAARFDLSVWEVKGSEQHLSYFHCNNQYNTPPGLVPKCLKTHAVIDE